MHPRAAAQGGVTETGTVSMNRRDPVARSRSVARGACALLLLPAVVGCSTLARPVASLSDVEDASSDGTINLLPLTAQTLPSAPASSQGFPASFLEADEFDYAALGPGDRLNVRIWESGTPTVFTGAQGTDLGELTVDESGRLYLPYVGAIRVAGMTIPEVRSAVIGRLSTVVLRPQVDIRAVERRSTLVSVQGNAAKTGVYPIDQGRTRLSSLLAETAPNQENAEMLRVAVRRDGQSGEVRLSDIYRNPELDIALRPGDSIILSNVVDHVTVLGAAGLQGQVRIAERDFSLLDAIAAARGLNQDTADPRAVFLLRASETPGAPPSVYQLDMRRPDAIALANRFVVQDGDAILISNAPFAQTRQLLSAFAMTLNSARAATTIGP